ncbi:MAG: PadR family transcriptional regulator [Candidatus Cloacimonetes bacterium]|nr:PadR family transcriptional regulator [Candidatus Cloacimonadota bacterium]
MSRNNLVVLGLLNEKPCYGYEMKWAIEHRELNLWAQIKLPSIYKAINTLEEKGYITGKKEIIGNTPPRTVYKLTESGKAYLRTLVLKYLTTMGCGKNFTLGCAFMLNIISLETFLSTLDSQLEQQHKLLEGMNNQKEHINSEHVPFNWKRIFYMGKSYHTAYIETLKNLRKDALDPKNAHWFTKE